MLNGRDDILSVYKYAHRRQKLTLLHLFTELFHKDFFSFITTILQLLLMSEEKSLRNSSVNKCRKFNLLKSVNKSFLLSTLPFARCHNTSELYSTFVRPASMTAKCMEINVAIITHTYNNNDDLPLSLCYFWH